MIGSIAKMLQLFPHISYVMNKYKKHLERGELKRWGKEVCVKTQGRIG